MDIQEGLHKATRLQSDSIALRDAQPDQIKTIAYLLAQTVALHFYEMWAACSQLPARPCFMLHLDPTCGNVTDLRFSSHRKQILQAEPVVVILADWQSFGKHRMLCGHCQREPRAGWATSVASAADWIFACLQQGGRQDAQEVPGHAGVRG